MSAVGEAATRFRVSSSENSSPVLVILQLFGCVVTFVIHPCFWAKFVFDGDVSPFDTNDQ